MLYLLVKNETPYPLLKGQACYVTGTESGGSDLWPRPTVDLAIANDESKSLVVGLVSRDIPSGEYGFLMSYGTLRVLNTSQYFSQDVLYLSETIPGAWTTIPPVYPNQKVILGVVSRTDINRGSIVVSISDEHSIGGSFTTEWGMIQGDIFQQKDLIELLNQKADITHTHELSEIADFFFYFENNLAGINNNNPYTPTNEYNVATKKYVDDNESYISNVQLSGSDLIFSGVNLGFSGTIPLPSSFDYWTITADSGTEDIYSTDELIIAGGTDIVTSYNPANNTLTINSSAGGAYNWSIDVDSTGADSILSGQTLNINSGTNVTLGYIAGTNTLTVNATDTNDIDYINLVELNGTDLDFSSIGNAWSGTIDLSSLLDDTNTTYDLTTAPTGTAIRLTGSDATNDDVTLTGAGATTITRLSDAELQISSTDTDTTYTASNVGAGDEVFKQLNGTDFEFRTLVEGTGISITEGTDTITITNIVSDTDTTYNLTVPSSTTNVRLLGSDASTSDITFTAGNEMSITRVGPNELEFDFTGNSSWQINVDSGGGDDINFGDILNVNSGTNVTLTYTAGTNTLEIAADDNYVDSLSFNTSSNILTVGRTGALADLTTDLSQLDTVWNLSTSDTASTHPVTNGESVEIAGDLNLEVTRFGADVSITHSTTGVTTSNTGVSVIQNITSDAYGHITAVGMAELSTLLDNYEYWTLVVDNVTQENVTSQATLDFISGSNMNIVYDTGNNELTFHATNTTYTVSDGIGLTSTDIHLDFDSLSVETSADSVNDYFAFWDDSASVHKKITLDSLGVELQTLYPTQWSLTADGDVFGVVVEDNTVEFTAGTGIDVSRSSYTITIESVPSEIDHNLLLNYNSAEHINHNSVSIIAGDGLVGGGTIAATRTIDIDFGEFNVFVGTPSSSDTMVIYNEPTGPHERISFSQLVTYFDSNLSFAENFLELTDTPSNYTGDANKFVRVNSTPDALEFVSASSINLSDFNNDLSINGDVTIRVNDGVSDVGSRPRLNFLDHDLGGPGPVITRPLAIDDSGDDEVDITIQGTYSSITAVNSPVTLGTNNIATHNANFADGLSQVVAIPETVTEISLDSTDLVYLDETEAETRLGLCSVVDACIDLTTGDLCDDIETCIETKGCCDHIGRDNLTTTDGESRTLTIGSSGATFSVVGSSLTTGWTNSGQVGIGVTASHDLDVANTIQARQNLTVGGNFSPAGTMHIDGTGTVTSLMTRSAGDYTSLNNFVKTIVGTNGSGFFFANNKYFTFSPSATVGNNGTDWDNALIIYGSNHGADSGFMGFGIQSPDSKVHFHADTEMDFTVSTDEFGDVGIVFKQENNGEVYTMRYDDTTSTVQNFTDDSIIFRTGTTPATHQISMETPLVYIDGDLEVTGSIITADPLTIEDNPFIMETSSTETFRMQYNSGRTELQADTELVASVSTANSGATRILHIAESPLPSSYADFLAGDIIRYNGSLYMCVTDATNDFIELSYSIAGVVSLS